MEETNGKLTEIDERLRVTTDESRFLFREAQRQINAVNEFLEGNNTDEN